MIQLKNVSKYYYSKGMIASGITKVSLTFDLGEFVVITGESGSGKSTLLNVISGLDSYEEGEMYIDGKETSHYLASDFEEYRKKYIGNIFQDFNLVNSYTVYQNIELILLINGYSRDEIRQRVPDIISKVGLGEYAKTKVSKLSGGQRQRVAIARALAKDTDIIVADEPTGNLDSVSAEGIVQILRDIAHDKLVIVVTHNFEQFEKYATRKIKMHDGKVIEDIRETPADMKIQAMDQPAVLSENRHEGRNITVGSRVRLGVRNTFNILPKFLLLLLVFVFLVTAVASQYTTLKNQKAEQDKLGFNDYFRNYSEDRVVLKKEDGSAFTAEDLAAIADTANIKSVVQADIMLDDPVYIEQGDLAYAGYPRPISEFRGTLAAGVMPEAENEVILEAYEDGIDPSTVEDDILGKTFRITLEEDKTIDVTVTGLAYKAQDGGFYYSSGDLYMGDQMMNSLLKDSYRTISTVKVLINGKEQQHQEGSPLYRLVPNSNVPQGKAIVSEDMNTFYDTADAEGNSKGKTISVTVKNLFYSQSLDLQVSNTYSKKTFEKVTGVSDYDANNGTIYVSQADYDNLFGKGNFQTSVYVKNVKEIDATLEKLRAMGYTTLPLKDTLINMFSDITSMIATPMAVVMTVALFFIAYFVIRLILKSRSTYFSILRMLGMAKKHIRRILDVEMLLTVNIAYFIFIGCAFMVHYGVIDVEYIRNLIEYMTVRDYVILYAILMFMAYLISGKFARSLFRKTAMGTFREEE